MTLPDAALQLLPEPGDIFYMSDDSLESIAERFYGSFNTKQRVEPDGLVPSVAEDLLSHYGKYLNIRDHSLPRLLKIMDPNGYGVVTEDSFLDSFPFLLRLVQVQLEAEEERGRLMKKLVKEETKAAEVLKSRALGKEDTGPGFMKPTAVSAQKAAKENSAPAAAVSSDGRPHKPFSRQQCDTPEPKLEEPVSPSNGGADKPRSIAAISVSRKEIIILRSLFEEVDVLQKGFITWDQLRAKSPTLPREPLLDGKKLERDVQLDFCTFLRIVFPEVPEEDAKPLSLIGAKVREFVLPGSKKRELEDQFCALNGGKIKDNLKPHQLVSGLRASEYSEYCIAEAYTLFFVEPKEEIDITLDRFRTWYCDKILSDTFKVAHTKTVKPASSLVAA